MKQDLIQLITTSLGTIVNNGELVDIALPAIQIENTRDPAHGDFACNIAMVIAKQAKKNPRDLAHMIIENLPDNPVIDKVEIAGPGFINFFLKSDSFHSIVSSILDQQSQYGDSTIGENQSILIEFVSANPTGPLHIGHGRGAAYGATVANILIKAGYTVDTEYYINDAGRQMDILATSVWLRYIQLSKPDIPFPGNGYKGDYIKAISEKLKQQYSNKFLPSDISALLAEYDSADIEKEIDSLIAFCKKELGPSNYEIVFAAGLDDILQTIKDDLSEFNVSFSNWFSERSLVQDNSVEECTQELKQNNRLYEKDGALWFKSTDFGDEKDRVLVRENGIATYFSSDIAYHRLKFSRGYDMLIDIWGADHHGYIPRVKAAMQALNLPYERLHVLLVQFATLYRGQEKLQMSTRSGEFITLKELIDEVGKDATRFFYILRKSEQHLDFDLELAKSQSNENPVYYIQYAHARICSVFKQLYDKGYSYQQAEALLCLDKLTDKNELILLQTLSRYPEVIESAARAFEPHQLAYYLKDLATAFHAYYNSSHFIVDENKLRNARLALIDACRVVIKNGLTLLDVSAPESM